jgi:uncharacterized protein
MAIKAVVINRNHRGHDAGPDLEPDLRLDPAVLKLHGTTDVDRDPDWVFRELHDPATLLSCVPGANLTSVVDPDTFEARIAVGVGPFKLAYGGIGRIIASNPESRTAALEIDGHSVSNLPQIHIRMTMVVNRRPRGAEIRMSFEVVVTDRTGLFSRAWIDPIACDLLDRTIRQVKHQLEATPEAPGPAAA